MAFVANTEAATDVTGTGATLHGSWSGATEDEFGFSVDVRHLWGYGGSATNVAGEANYATESGSHASDLSGLLDKDRVVTFEFRARDQDGGFINSNGQLTFQTLADDMVFGTPSMDSIGDTYAYAGVNYQAMTFESTAILTIQYKLDTEPTVWTDGSAVGGLFGSGVYHPSLSIAGLLANTLYNLRFKGVRTTANATTAFSSPISFTTAAEPGHGPRIIMMG